jgi:hypothetical protein
VKSVQINYVLARCGSIFQEIELQEVQVLLTLLVCRRVTTNNAYMSRILKLFTSVNGEENSLLNVVNVSLFFI